MSFQPVVDVVVFFFLFSSLLLVYSASPPQLCVNSIYSMTTWCATCLCGIDASATTKRTGYPICCETHGSQSWKRSKNEKKKNKSTLVKLNQLSLLLLFGSCSMYYVLDVSPSKWEELDGRKWKKKSDCWAKRQSIRILQWPKEDNFYSLFCCILVFHHSNISTSSSPTFDVNQRQKYSQRSNSWSS